MSNTLIIITVVQKEVGLLYLKRVFYLKIPSG